MQTVPVLQPLGELRGHGHNSVHFSHEGLFNIEEGLTATGAVVLFQARCVLVAVV